MPINGRSTSCTIQELRQYNAAHGSAAPPPAPDQHEPPDPYAPFGGSWEAQMAERDRCPSQPFCKAHRRTAAVLGLTPAQVIVAAEVGRELQRTAGEGCGNRHSRPIADKWGLHRETVQGAYRKLADAGLVELSHLHVRGARGTGAQAIEMASDGRWVCLPDWLADLGRLRSMTPAQMLALAFAMDLQRLALRSPHAPRPVLWLSKAQLAEFSGVSVRWARKAVQDLCAMGYLIELGYEPGRGRAAAYLLSWSAIAADLRSLGVVSSVVEQVADPHFGYPELNRPPAELNRPPAELNRPRWPV